MLYQNDCDPLILLGRVFYNDFCNPFSWTMEETVNTEGHVRFRKENGKPLQSGSLSFPVMDSYKDDILISLQLINDLVLPVPDCSYEVIMEHQLLSHLIHDVLEQPEEDRVLTLTQRSLVLGFCLTLPPTYLYWETCFLYISQCSP